MLVGLVILFAGMFGMGWWVRQQIDSSVIQQSAANTALYVSSSVEPNLQELASGDSITLDHQAILTRLLQDTSLGQRITSIKVWNKEGRIVYATDPESIGQGFPIEANLASALHGWVKSGISNLDKSENVRDRGKTIKHYVTNILQKLQVRNRVEAALLAQSGARKV
jgi:hypothetical protein